MSSGYGMTGGTTTSIYPRSLIPSFLTHANPQYRISYTTAATGPNRCFPFWQEVLACYTVSLESSDPKAKHKCMPVLDDYYECLHHKKEVRDDEGARMQ
jgi:hypothetical protein